MNNWIIGTPEFKDQLNLWLLKSDQQSANFLYNNRSRIPPMFQSYNQKLYRGLTVTEDFLTEIDKTGTRISDHSSWSKDLSVAKKFATDKKFMMTTSQNPIPIIMERVFRPNELIFDLDAFILFMGIKQLTLLGYDEINLDSAIKEKEVLVTKGIRIQKIHIRRL